MSTARSRASHRASRGFTLIEVLVALVIMALMSVMAWRAVSALTTTRNVTEAHMDGAETLQTLIRQWELDLREVQDNRQVDKTAVSFDGTSLRLVRRTEGGLQLVSWQLRDGRLTRWASPAATTRATLEEYWFRSRQLSPEELRSMPGISGVVGWQMYFFRNNAWTNAQSTGDTDKTNGTIAPPNGVRMKIQFGGDSPYQGELTREVQVPAGSTT